MITVEEYKNESKEWKSTPFNFRGNPENKKLVKDFKEANNLDSEGEALDYILKAFLQSFGKANPLTKVVSEKEAEIQNLRKHLQTVEADFERMAGNHLNEVNRLQLEIQRLKANPTVEFPDSFVTLKSATEKQLPILFKLPVETIPVSNEQFIALLVEYCERDPSKEFPFKPEAQKIIDGHLAAKASPTNS